MTSRLLLLSLLLALLGGCFSSTARTAEEAESLPETEPLAAVDHCVATSFAWENDATPREADRALLFANYPLFSPEYQLDLYGADIWVTVDEAFDARYRSRDALSGLEDVVFGRREGEETWRVLDDPDAVCPPLPEGTEWPTRS